MSLFNFTLTLSGVTRSTPHLEDALYKAHCDDALICFYGTAAYLDFDRESDTLEHAILSAIHDIESAPTLNARVESVDAVLVGLSDIAELTGVSRQAISLLKEGSRGAGQFPGPIQRVKGSSPLWRWQTVVEWLVSEHPRTLDSLNLALQLRASRESQTVLEYFQGLSHPQTVNR